MHAMYNLDQVPPEALSFTHPYMIIGLLGCAFWIMVDILVIRMNHRQRTVAMPAAAITMNIGWEFLTSFIFPDPLLAWRIAEVGWFALDSVIVVQMFRYGPSQQADPALASRFRRFCAGAIVLSVLGQLTFVAQYQDALAFVAGFLINLLMSILFIFFYFARRDTLRGISKGVAWCKMLGTICTGFEAYFLIRIIDPNLPNMGFFEFLWASIFVVDALYVYYVHKQPGREPAPAGAETQSVAAPA